MTNWSQYLTNGENDDKENTHLDADRGREAGTSQGEGQDRHEDDSPVPVYTGD